MEVWNQEVMLNAKTGGQSKEKGQVRMSETKVWGPGEQGRPDSGGGWMEGRGKDREGGMEDRQRTGVRRREPAPKGVPLPNHWRRGRGRDCPQWASKNQGPSPGNPSKGTPESASLLGLGEEGDKACRLPPCSLRCEYLPTSPRSTPLPLPAGPALLTPHPTLSLSSPGRGPGGAGGWAGPWDILFLFTPSAAWPGMSPVMVTGLLECVLREEGPPGHLGRASEPRDSGHRGGRRDLAVKRVGREKLSLAQGCTNPERKKKLNVGAVVFLQNLCPRQPSKRVRDQVGKGGGIREGLRRHRDPSIHPGQRSAL